MSDHLRDELPELLNEVGSLRNRLNLLENRINELINRQASTPSAPEPPPAPSVRQPTAPPEVEIPAPPAPPVITAEADQVSPQERLSLEQRVGASWLNKIGVIVLILAAVFFFQYAVHKGWINETIRVLIVGAGGILLLAAGEWAFRRAMRMFAGGVTAGGIALLYASAYAASPKFYNLLGTPTSFTLMCVVTVLGVLLSLRSRMVSTAVLVQIGAYLTPFLLSTGRDEQVILMIYLLIIGAGFLFVASSRRWSALAPIALVGTLFLFVGWFAQFYAPPAAVRTIAFAWALFGLFALYAGLATTAGREHPFTGIALLAAAAPAMVIMHLVQHNDLSPASILFQWLVLNVVVLAVCLWRKWTWIRLGAFAWTLGGILILWYAVPLEMSPWFWSTWAWIFFGLFLLDIITRTWWPSARTIERLNAALGAAATAAMFGSTYYLLRGQYGNWMGLYTLLLAVAVLLFAWRLYKSSGKRLLAGSYFGQSLVLFTLVAPIQFDKATVSLVWACQAAVAMLLARRFASKFLTFKSVALLILAVTHFAVVDIPHDTRLASSALVLGSLVITWRLMLTLALTASALVSAALLSAGKPIFSEADDRFSACGLIWFAFGLLVWRTCVELSAVTATWWWLILAAGLTVVGLWRRRLWIIGSAALMLAAVSAKFLFYDTLHLRWTEPVQLGRAVVLNWQFSLGLVLAVIILACGRVLARRVVDWPRTVLVGMLAFLLGALLIVWAGSFEVNRYFDRPPTKLPVNAAQAEQMAYSIWWALYAAVLLAIGFAARYSPLRYMALAIFAVTLAKVFLLDMAGIEAGYRIASFVTLGGLLVAASLLYQRYFQSALAKWDKSRNR